MHSQLPFKSLRKSVGETNNEKGSLHLVMVPTTLPGYGTVLQSLDYSPVVSKEKTLAAIDEVASEGGLESIKKIVIKSERTQQATPGDKPDGNPYKWLNYLLGVICFMLVAYFMNLMKKTSGSGGSSGGFGKGKGGGIFGGGKKSGGLFGGAKGGRGGLGGRRR